MKKTFLFACAIFFAAFIFSSCEKCIDCKYEYKLAGDDTSKVYPQVCGSKTELDKQESVVNAEAAADNGATVTCERK
jgi:hypothetical protein